METATPRQLEFGGLVIEYDDRVIVPRPWTLSQSSWAAELLGDSPPGAVLELCAGVGHIGLAAVAGTARELVLVDADPTACGYARRNARRALPDRVTDVRQGRVDEVLAAEERFVGIVADPPWVPSHGVARFPEDPRTAIDGGPDGMDIAWACLDVAAGHLETPGWLLIQLGTVAQAEAVRTRVGAAPELGLDVVEVREHGDRGVLVHVARRGAG
jgi:methylase of polypeptide subunit release factors